MVFGVVCVAASLELTTGDRKTLLFPFFTGGVFQVAAGKGVAQQRQIQSVII